MRGRLPILLVVIALLSPATVSAAPESRPSGACIAGYHSAYGGQSIYSVSANPGDIIGATIWLDNTGCNTWTKGTASEARLGTRNPQPGQDQASALCTTGLTGWMGSGCNRIQQLDTQVPYGARGSFTFQLRAPSIDGIFKVYLSGLIEGITWMEDHGIYIQVTVGPYYGVQNTAFKKPNGQPILTQQSTCVYCVPAATTAWISYVWIAYSGSDAGHVFSHQDFWDNYFNADTQANSRNTITWPYTASDPPTLWSNCTTALGGNFNYPKRKLNASSDAGVDPYAATWGIFKYTPGGYYYHMHTYRGTTPALGRDYATRAIALSLARFDEPVGVLIGNGGHYVLATGVTADSSPIDFFWTTNISKIYIRDPLRDLSIQLRQFNVGTPDWDAVYTPYGYEGESPVPHPKTCWNTDCIDDARQGYDPYTIDSTTPSLWWGKFVTVERAISTRTQLPDTAFQSVR